MDLRELRLSIRRHWVVALIAFDICVLLGVAAAYLPSRQYTAKVTLIAEVREVPGSTPESVARAVSFELPSLAELVQSRSARDEAAAAVPVAYRNIDPDVAVNFTTSVFEISVVTGDPQASADWAAALGQWLEDQRSGPGFYNLRIVDPPLVPSAPSYPKPVPLIAVATVIGIIAAVFAAVVTGRIREAFDSTETIRQRLGTSVLAEVPSVRSLRAGTTPIVELLESGVPELVDAFQGLRTNTEFQIQEHGVRRIAVASFRAGEGKSTVAVGLAWSLAAVGVDTTLIDADLRRPSLHRRLGVPSGHGLADLLTGSAEDFVRPTSMNGLRYLPAGLPDGRPGDLVPVTLPKAMAELSVEGGLLIVDAPPMREVVETASILSQVRYVILVIDASTSELPEIAAAVDRLRESGSVLLGVVINRVRRRIFDRRSPYYDKTSLGAG